MTVHIQEIGPDQLAHYAETPSAFAVRAVLQVEPLAGGLGGLRLREVPVAPAYVKDYDASEEEGPDQWPAQFDVEHRGFFLARDGDRPVGGATVAFDTGVAKMTWVWLK
ncbi:MAG: hypothetical protein KKA73_16510 [Chloroflexi bacterium]|nr:hypothetical protein [Chloroflexota bacterium]MBU1749288.1 hypothetical protein [Chloroflexota bacterium]